MIQNINIQNYKSILDMDLPLGTFNVMIGANGCGKSNVLEAIAMASAASQDKLDYEYWGNRGIRVVSPKVILPLFEDCDANEIDISIKEDEGVFDFNIIYNDKNRMWTFPSFERRNNNQYLSQFLIFSPDDKKLRIGDNENRTYPLGINGEGLLSYLSELHTRENGLDVINEIKENLTVLDWFDDIEIPDENLYNNFDISIKDVYLKENANTFTQRSANEGFLYLLFYLTLIISDETPRFFAIENIETGFNPKLCREIVRRMVNLAKRHGKQIIVTTHNPAVLDGLDLQDDQQKLISVYRDIDGVTNIDVIKRSEDAKMPLSQAWIKGLLGGLPNNF